MEGFHNAKDPVCPFSLCNGTVKILDRSVSFVYTTWERVYIKSIEGEEYSQHRCNRERDSSAERSPQRINNEKDAEKKVALELPG